MDDELVDELVTKLNNGQLTFWVGAGVSMGGDHPLPSADRLAAQCAEEFTRINGGAQLPEHLNGNLEAIAQHFFDSGDLIRIFISRLVPWDEFKSRCYSSSHLALADFLLTRVAPIVVSTNYDTRIEEAAFSLGEGHFLANIHSAEVEPSKHNRLLKIHGCAMRNPDQTLWCAPQLEDQPFSEWVDSAKTLLAAHFRNKDLVLAGYWTHWPHLYEAICSILEACEPNSVYLVNPDPANKLQQQTPKLWDWANQKRFRHVQVYADDFFDQLSRGLGNSFLRRALYEGRQYAQDFGGTSGFQPQLNITNQLDLYNWRRDLLGIPRSLPVDKNETSSEPTKMSAGFINRLLEIGAVTDNDRLILNGQAVRVIGAAGSMSRIKHLYANEPEINQLHTICVCPQAIDDGGVPGDITRAGQEPNIIRGEVVGSWYTLNEAKETLFL